MKHSFLFRMPAYFVLCGGSAVIALAAEEYRSEIVIPPGAHSRIVYGAQHLAQAIERGGGRAQVVTLRVIELRPHTIAVGTPRDGAIFAAALEAVSDREQGFALVCRPDSSSLVAGVDPSGALYGCLELAERIEALDGRLPENLAVNDYPRMRLRGPCIGLQRPKPEYDDVMYDHPYLPETFPWFYDKALWTQYLDLLARHRSNTLYLWNGHPFTSVLRLEKYPEAREIEAAQLDANIELFRWLCREADRRGIWVVQFFYNIHVSHSFARHHGIAFQHGKPSPLVSEYTSYCITEFIRNYPNVGLMMCLGEALKDEYDAQWLSEVIIPAVKAGLGPGQPQPPIIVRNHSTPIEEVLNKATPLYDNIYTMGKYTSESLVSDKVAGGPGPQVQRNEWELRRRLSEKFLFIINVHCLCNLEPFRWGSPGFVRRAIASCVETGIKGLHLYPLRYWEWPYTADRTEPRLLQPERDWIWFAAWARYAWNPYRDDEAERTFWMRELQVRYGTAEAARRILTAYERSGDIMPHIVRNLSAQPWNIEAHTLGQTVKQFLDSRLWYSGPGESIAEYAEREAAGRPHQGETPPDAAKAIVEKAETAVREAEAAASHVTRNEAEFKRLLNDMRALKQVARFYAHKSEAAIDWLIYLKTAELDRLEQCVLSLEQSVEAYRRLTDLTTNAYLDCASWHGPSRQIPFPADVALVWSEALPEFEKELAVARHNAEFIRSLQGGKVPAAIESYLSPRFFSERVPDGARPEWQTR